MLKTLTVAGACYHMRAPTQRLTPHISYSGIPEEDTYSVDILGEDKEALLTITTNESKTDSLYVYIAENDEVMDDGMVNLK